MEFKLGNMTEIQGLISQLMSPETDIRTIAENQYEQIEVPLKASILYQLYQQQPNVDVETRSMCLVLLRRIVTNDWSNFWTHWSLEIRDKFCRQLLFHCEHEDNTVLRKRLVDVLSEVARNTIDDDSGQQTWSGIIEFVEKCAISSSALLRETGMILIENVPSIFGIDQSRCMPGIKSMFASSLSFAGDSFVRTAAVRAYVAFLIDNDEDLAVIRALSDLVPVLLKVCEQAVTAQDDDDIPLQCLGDLATSLPKILRPYLTHIGNLCISILGNKKMDDSYRHSALEVLVSLCESSPAMVRLYATQFIPLIVHECMAMMTELDDDDVEWYTADTVDEDDEDNVTIGESSLDRLACALGGKVTFPPVLERISQLVSSEDWKSRHAGIMAFSTIGEGCKKTMLPMIEQLVGTVMTYLADSHPRVRYAACNALGQMSTDFAPTLQKKCHAKVVPALLLLLDDLPRVAAHAGAALVNFSEDCPKAIISMYLGAMMEKMELVLESTFKDLLEKGKKLVLEQIITTVASVADAAQDHFIAFYDRLMPPLKYILENSKHENLRLLRGKTIECISLIGLAVGREKFLIDANDIMEVLLNSQSQFGTMDSDDPQISYMISAWARFCKILGPDFARYLPLVMPAMIKAAEFKPEVTVMTDEEAEDEKADPDWSFVSLGEKQTFGIRTTGLEDKATACEMLACYARELKGAFADYVEPVTQLMIPLLKFYFHDGSEFVTQMWTHIFPAVLQAIKSEHDLEVVADGFEALSQCIETLGVGALDSEKLGLLVELISTQLAKHQERVAEKDKKRAGDDHDEEQEAVFDEQLEFESGVLAHMADVFHTLFHTYRDELLPSFDTLHSQLAPLLSSTRNFADRQWAICIFDDLIEFTAGVNSIKYQSVFYEPMIRALSDEHAEVRQASAYGFGIMAMHGGDHYSRLCADSMNALAQMIHRDDAKSSSEAATATENAISAVAKILKYNSKLVDNVDKIIPYFISWLPVSEDKEECPHIFGYLCDLIDSRNVFALGEKNTKLPTIVAIIAKAFEDDALEGDHLGTKERMINIVRLLKNDQFIFETVISAANLDSNQQDVLRNLN